MEWRDNGAVGPDGTEYMIQTDHIRGEARMYWAMYRSGVEAPVLRDDWQMVPIGDDSPDRRVAKRNAERFAKQRMVAVPGQPEQGGDE